MGARPRQAIRPVNLAFGERNICERSSEWTPSAPTSASPRAVRPSARVSVAPCSSCVNPVTRALTTTASGFKLRNRLQQHGVQISPVHHPIGRAEPRNRIFAQIEELPGLARVPETHLLGRRLADDRLEALLEAKFDQHARTVGRNLDAGAQILQFGRLFEHRHIDAALEQRQRRRKTADAGARDQDMEFFAARCPSLLTGPAHGRTLAAILYE